MSAAVQRAAKASPSIEVPEAPRPSGLERKAILSTAAASAWQAAYQIEAMGGVLMREARADAAGLDSFAAAIGARMVELYIPISVAIRLLEDPHDDVTGDLENAQHVIDRHAFLQNGGVL